MALGAHGRQVGSGTVVREESEQKGSEEKGVV